jgi:hypothetical protein
MYKTCRVFAVLFFLTPVLCQAQKSSDFLPEKPGKWSYSSNIKTPGAEVVAFNKNVANLAEWFHRKVPLLINPKGFDLDACAYGIWDDKYKLQHCNYGQRGELNFNFLMFYSNGRQWIIEPPHWSFNINNTETGHGSNTNLPGWDSTKDPASLEKPMNEAAADLNDLFRIFPFVRDIAPGVRLYGDGNLIVFNPDRPPFWIPVTLREVAEMKLAYYKFKELDLLPYLKEEIAKLTEEDLNSLAYSGNDDLFILKVHPKMENQEMEYGGQIMRFNPDYWDRSLPPSAIQFMTFYYPERSQSETEEFFTNNGYPIFGDVIMNSIKLEELAGLIVRKK